MQPEYSFKISRKEQQFTLRKKKLRAEQPQGGHILGQHNELKWILLTTISISFSKRDGSKMNTPANLKRDKPNAFHSIADEEEILETTKRSHINSHVHKCHADKALIQIKCPHENLEDN